MSRNVLSTDDDFEIFQFGDVSAYIAPDGVTLVEINRPPNNFFDVSLISSLADCYEALETLTTCRVIVLCSRGKNFCSGADFSDRALESGAMPFQVSDLYLEGARLFRSHIPVVAAVQGAAIGGGLGLACSADFRVASKESKFSANFAHLGFHQGFGLTVSLPGIVGQQRSWELLYTAKRISGTDALAMGLCDRLAGSETLREEATAFAREIARSAPLAVRSIRVTMRANLLEELDSALEREASEQNVLRTTNDFKEGVRAMSERRSPRFYGN